MLGFELRSSCLHMCSHAPSRLASSSGLLSFSSMLPHLHLCAPSLLPHLCPGCSLGFFSCPLASAITASAAVPLLPLSSHQLSPLQLKVGKKGPLRKAFLGFNVAVPEAPQGAGSILGKWADPAWWAHSWDPSTLEPEAREAMSSRPASLHIQTLSQRVGCCWGARKVAQESVRTRSHI